MSARFYTYLNCASNKVVFGDIQIQSNFSDVDTEIDE